ncbi:MAG: lasso peptide biosynthesis B2 protein [Acidobacteriota bacterium]|nr:lasso peptide biosynthesis B2 protein [Acidobacteriota bacterium]
MSLRNKLSRVRQMSGAERWLIAEAVVSLGAARAMILLMPFRWIAPWLERKPRGSGRPAVPDPVLTGSVRRAVTIAANHVPWNAVCLPQAMAAKFMLALRGCPSTLHLGVARTGAALTAHAWLEAGNVIVVGEKGVDAVTPVARFG